LLEISSAVIGKICPSGKKLPSDPAISAGWKCQHLIEAAETIAMGPSNRVPNVWWQGGGALPILRKSKG